MAATAAMGLPPLLRGVPSACALALGVWLQYFCALPNICHVSYSNVQAAALLATLGAPGVQIDVDHEHALKVRNWLQQSRQASSSLGSGQRVFRRLAMLSPHALATCALSASIGMALSASIGMALSASIGMALSASIGMALAASIGMALSASIGMALAASIGMALAARLHQ
jgi:hypothetical protein